MGVGTDAGVKVEGPVADTEAIASASSLFRSVASLISHTIDCVPFPAVREKRKHGMSRYISKLKGTMVEINIENHDAMDSVF